MAFQVSPGVNVSEIDLTTVVPQVSTSIGALAGAFRWGPVDQRVLVSSEDDLVANFQSPNSNTAVDFFTASNFLSYADALQVVRVIQRGSGTNNIAKNAQQGTNNNVVILNDDHYDDNFSSGVTSAGDFVARFPGALGNSLKTSICPSANAYEKSLSTISYAVTRNSKTVTLNKPAAGSSSLGNSAVSFVAGDILLLGPDKEAVKIKSLGTGNAANTITLDGNYTGNTGTFTNITRRWEFFNAFDRAPGTSPFTANTGGTNDEIHIVIADEDGEWTGAKNTILEAYEKVSLASDAKGPQGDNIFFKDVINRKSFYARFASQPALANAGNATKGVGTAYGTGTNLPITASFVAGSDGANPTAAHYITGYDFFKSTEDVDISFILGAGADQTRALDLINNVAESRKDCIAVISPESADVVDNGGFSGKQAEDIIAFRNSLPSSSFAVMDSGYKRQFDKFNDVFRAIPLNGDTAGIMARSDNIRDPWYSPAGFQRGQVKNVVKLTFNPRKADRDELYKAGVNPVVSFPGQGTVLFGDKTLLSTPSAFDRINVRRLFIVLEKAIAIAAQSSLFEFNDVFTRQQFKNLVEPFLREVQGRRGIVDFSVICDTTNNTSEVIDRNEFVGDIFIKPNRSINFIQLNFVAVRSGVEFSEIVGSV